MNCESLSEIHPCESSKSIHVRESEKFNSHNVIRLMLLGNSGCGKSSFVQFISGNKKKDSPDGSRVKGDNRLFDMIESPGFQSGAGGVWHEIVSHSNLLGGVDVFLILLNATEEDATRVYRELNNFERKYVANTHLFWERSVVVFTHADSKGSTLSEQEKNIQILLHNLNADKLRQIVINADNRCLYVNSLDHTPAYQTAQLRSLYNQINRIQEDFLLHSVSNMNDHNPMTTFGTNLTLNLDSINNEFDEVQANMKKKKKNKILNLSRIKEVTRLRRGSKEMDEKSIKNKPPRKSSIKFVINPLKRILTHNRQGYRDYEKTHSRQSNQHSTSRVHECEVPEKLKGSSTLPDLYNMDKDDIVIKENLQALAAYEQNKKSHNQHSNSPPSLENSTTSKQLIFTVVSDGSDSDWEEFFTPPQSLSEF